MKPKPLPNGQRKAFPPKSSGSERPGAQTDENTPGEISRTIPEVITKNLASGKQHALLCIQTA